MVSPYPRSHVQLSMLRLSEGEDDPIGHAVQFPAPPDTLYVPAAHGSQAPGPSSNFKYPGRHSTHPDDPNTSFSLPGGQGVQSNPPAPSYPGLHTHAALLVLPAGDWLATEGQARHSPGPVKFL